MFVYTNIYIYLTRNCHRNNFTYTRIMQFIKSKKKKQKNKKKKTIRKQFSYKLATNNISRSYNKNEILFIYQISTHLLISHIDTLRPRLVIQPMPRCGSLV